MPARPCPCTAKTKRPTSVAAAIVSTLVLVLLPKCPLCLAGYAAMLGLTLSAPVASALRIAIIVACAAVIAVAIVRAASGRLGRSRR